MKIGTCQECGFSRMRSQLDKTQLVCCYEPPRTMGLPGQGGVIVVSLFPFVDPTGDCGKWQPDPSVKRN